jgi:hypothetical protein
MSKTEATKIAKQYVDKHRKSLKASNKEMSAAVTKIARVLTSLKPPGDLKRSA